MSSVSEDSPTAGDEQAQAGGPYAEHAPHDDHGNTPAAWTAAIIMMVASVIGALGIILGNWPLFWIGGIGLVVVGAIAGKVMSMMGYGAQHDTPAEH